MELVSRNALCVSSIHEFKWDSLVKQHLLSNRGFHVIGRSFSVFSSFFSFKFDFKSLVSICKCPWKWPYLKLSMKFLYCNFIFIVFLFLLGACMSCFFMHFSILLYELQTLEGQSFFLNAYMRTLYEPWTYSNFIGRLLRTII